MDYHTPVRRPLEKELHREIDDDEDETHDISAALDFDADCGWSAITDAPVRQDRSAQLMRKYGSDELASGGTRIIIDKDSPLVEHMMNQLVLEAASSPLTSTVRTEPAERQLELTVSPQKPGQKRGREMDSDAEEESDEANGPPPKEKPFRDE